MPQTPAQKQATDRYRARNGRVQVNIELTPEDRQRWQAYARAQGMSLTAMARQCVLRCMAQDAFEAARRPRALLAGHRGHGGHGLSRLPNGKTRAIMPVR